MVTQVLLNIQCSSNSLVHSNRMVHLVTSVSEEMTRRMDARETLNHKRYK